MHLVAMRRPHGYAAMLLDTAAAKSAVEGVDYPAEAGYLVSGAEIHASNLDELMTTLPDGVATLSVYDGVGCVEREVAGWNLVASDCSILEAHDPSHRAWRHFDIGLRARKAA